jgi:hypothetical protein
MRSKKDKIIKEKSKIKNKIKVKKEKKRKGKALHYLYYTSLITFQVVCIVASIIKPELSW